MMATCCQAFWPVRAGGAELFTDGTWKKLSVRIGGPPMIHIPDGRFVAAVQFFRENSKNFEIFWRFFGQSVSAQRATGRSDWDTTRRGGEKWVAQFLHGLYG
jgi:hypothetical protein